MTPPTAITTPLRPISTDGIALGDAALDNLFRNARSVSQWLDRPVDEAILVQLQALTFLGPTAFNCEPLRIAFLRSTEAKQKLVPALMPLNVEKTTTAPVVAILATDPNFFDRIDDFLYPVPVSGLFRNNESASRETADRNANLQAGYFLLAARALGLDCGPISGIDRAAIDELFFVDTGWRTNFICALGYGDRSKVRPRLPRLSFGDSCLVL